MAIDTTFRSRLAALVDVLTDSNAVIPDKTYKFPMPWGKPGEIKIRVYKDSSGVVHITLFRKGEDLSQDPWS